MTCAEVSETKETKCVKARANRLQCDADAGNLDKRLQRVKLQVGHTYAFHNPPQRRFLRMSEWNVEASPEFDVNGLPAWATWEKFLVVDAGDGRVALHNAAWNAFVQITDQHDVKKSWQKNANELPAEWQWERFDVVDAGDGKVAFRSHSFGRYLKLNGWRADATTEPVGDSETFTPLDLTNTPSIVFGQTYAFHNPKHNRFLRMTSGDVDSSETCNVNELPTSWMWERFLVVDAGHGQVALQNPAHKSFVLVGNKNDVTKSMPTDSSQLSSADWDLRERFHIVFAGNGQVALRSVFSGHFVSMEGTHVNAHPTHVGFWESFTIVGVPGPLQVGHTYAFHNSPQRRFLRMSEWNVEASPEFDVNGLPAWATWEKFLVVDAGDGRVALHNAAWNAFVQITDQHDVKKSWQKNANELPAEWQWERFDVVDAGDGKVAFRSHSFGQYLKVNGWKVDATTEPVGAWSSKAGAWNAFVPVDMSQMSTLAIENSSRAAEPLVNFVRIGNQSFAPHSATSATSLTQNGYSQHARPSGLDARNVLSGLL